MKNKKKGVLIAVVVIALIVAAVAAVCINKKAIQENLKRDRPRQQSKSRIQRS